MQFKEVECFEQAASALGGTVYSLLRAVDGRYKATAKEIRLRVGSPVLLSLPSGTLTVSGATVTEDMIREAVMNLCGQSLYSHQQEIAGGYIPIAGGHRAGVCGAAVSENGKVTALRDYFSLCIRVAREHTGCADRLLEDMRSAGICSAVIAGPPGSGKTTVLRDLACSLAEGKNGRPMAVAVVDERKEIAMASGSRIFTLCDVLSGYPKAEGIIQAIRALAPEVIICDEIGDENDIAAVEAGVNAGVHMLCSVHAGSARELVSRPVGCRLLRTGAFERFVLLCGRERPGTIDRIMDRKCVYELACRCADDNMLGADGFWRC